VGPNGRHHCLVLQLLGPSVPDVVLDAYEDDRLPAPIAKSVVRQVLEGLDFLAKLKIGHGG
jgi:serine/threonine-protein kinase SRPK3